MAQIPGSVPLTGKVAPTDTTDTFATHIDIYGEGGYMTVADQAERDAITTERRKQGMAVFQNDTNKMYILQGGTANTNWTEFTGGGIATMQNVFDASTPNVDATDQSKTLILKASDVTLTADNDDPNAPATATGDLTLVSNSDIGGHHNTPTRLRLRGGQFGQGEIGLLGIAAQDPQVSSPAVGDILVVDSLDPLAPGAPIFATEAKLKFARPSSLNVGGLQSVIESGGTYLGDDTKTKDVSITVSTNPTVPNRFAHFSTKVGALSGQPNFIVSRAELSSQGVISNSQILTTISSTLRNNSFPYSSSLSLDGLNGIADLRSWNETRVNGLAKVQMDSDGEVEIFAGTPQQPQGTGSALHLRSTGTVDLAGSGGDLGIISSDNINISALGNVNIAGAAGDIKFIGTGLGTPTQGDMLVAKNATGQVQWATSPINQTLQDIMDNGSVGSVATNIDMVTVDPAVTTGRFCRMRTTLSGTTTRTLIQAQGLVGDTTSEVILTASDAVNLGEESKILLSGLTGDIKITGTGMGTPEVGDVLSAKTVTNDEATMEWTPGVQNVKVTLTAADILNLHNTYVELIPAPGVGKFIQVLSVMQYLDFQTTPYTTSSTPPPNPANSQIIMMYGNSNSFPGFTQLMTVQGLQQTQDWYQALSNFPYTSINVSTWQPNTGVYAASALANTNGDSPIHVYISYIIKNL